MSDTFQHNNLIDSVFKAQEVETDDKLGTYPEKVHVSALPERRYLWTTRILAVLTFVNVSFNIILPLVIFMLIPMMRVTPRLLTFDKLYPTLVWVPPTEVRTSALATITEELVTTYVTQRLTIVGDIDEMKDRWADDSQLRWMSGKNWQNSKLLRERDLKYLKVRGLTREVIILNTSKIDGGLYQVTFDTKEIYPESEEADYKRWSAFLRVSGAPMPPEAALKNPLNFIVKTFSIGNLPHPSEEPDKYLGKKDDLLKPFIV